MYHNFIAKHSGSSTSASVLWTGNKLDSSRSFYWYNDGIFMISTGAAGSRQINDRFVLMHELAHHYGAYDHYLRHSVLVALHTLSKHIKN